MLQRRLRIANGSVHRHALPCALALRPTAPWLQQGTTPTSSGGAGLGQGGVTLDRFATGDLDEVGATHYAHPSKLWQ